MISVCMATYNGGEFVLEQLKSILPQLDKCDEIIISDDLSTDCTIGVIQSINDDRIKVHVNKVNLGYSRNFENALNLAKGDIIFISDQDDVWLSNKVELMLKALEKADMVVSDAVGVDQNLNQIYPSHFKLNHTTKGFLINFLKTRYIGACMAFKKEILQKVLPLPLNVKLCAYDYWLAVVSEYYYQVTLVDVPLLKYRRHSNNASSGGAFSNNNFWNKIKVRIYTFRELLKRK